MKYKKFALLALAAGMIVGCGEGPSAPDWSAEFKSFVKNNFHGLEVPYFGTGDLGSFTYAIHEDYGYAEIFGGELESSEPIKAAATLLEDKGFVDLYAAYRDDPTYAQYVSEWTYPMEYRFEVENVGPRYIRIGLSGELPEPNKAEGEEEPAEPARSFYAQVFDPYYYSWFDSLSSDLISIAFGEKTGETTYKEDETIYEELVPYLGQATYESSGMYVSYLDDAIAEVAENGYLRFWMKDVVREELDAYAADLKEAEKPWTVYTYSEHELEPGYLGRLYKLVSPTGYFTIDVYFADGEALFRVAKADTSIPQVIKDMEPALFASNEVTAYDFEYFENEKTGESGYSYLELSEEAAQPSGESLRSAAAAYSALLADESLNAAEVVEFGLLSAAQAQGVLDVKDNQVVVYADYQMSGIVQTETGYAFNYYFFWGVEVSDWPTYPVELTNEFIAAAGASNIHQFFEQADGTFKFGTEAESEAAVAAVFNAIKGLDGAEVLTEYADGIGRVKVSDTKMAVIELITETEESETGKEETYYGYYVTLADIPTFEEILTIVAPTVPGCTEFDFVETTEKGSYYFVAPTEDQTIGETIFNNLLALSSEEVEVNTLVPYAFEEGEGLGRVQVTDKQVSVMVYSYEGQMYYQVDIGELPVFPDAVNAVATALGLSSVYQFQYYADYKEYIYFPAGVPEDFGAAAEACFNKLAAIAGVEVLEPFSYTPETETADAEMTGDIYLGDNLHVYLDFASGGNYCVCIGNYYKEPAGEHPYTLSVSTALGAEADAFSWDTSTGSYSAFAEEFGPTEDTLEAATEFFASVSPVILGVAEFADETFVPSNIETIHQVDSYWGDEWDDFEISYESENYIVTIYIDGYYASWGYGYNSDVTISIQPK